MMQSLFPYILLACGLAASLALFLSMKREVRSNARKTRVRVDEIAQKVAASQAREPEPVVIQPAALRPGMNINKRVQVMRMVRRNEDISHISAALGVTRKEVELLIRVQKMSAGR